MGLSKKGNIQFIKINYINDFEVIIGTSVNNNFPIHIHQKYCIGIVKKGTALLKSNNLETKLNKGFIYFINPEEPHKLQSIDSEGFNHIVFCFNSDFVNHYFNYDNLNNATLRFNKNIIFDNLLFERIITFSNMIKCKITKTNVEYELMGLFSEMYQNFSFFEIGCQDNNKKSDGILMVRDYIKDNSKISLSLNEMASIAGLSKFHFLRTFKHEIGISPYDFQIQVKIKLAKKMLLQGYHSSYIAAELGFSDQSHFVKFFKKNTGVTPLKFFKMNLKFEVLN